METKNNNIKSQILKGILELSILNIIKHKEVYSNDLLEILKSKNIITIEGTIYPLLTRLKNNGYLQYKWIESNSGPPRKYYNITYIGKEYLEELNDNWNEISNGVNEIINSNK